MPKTVQEVQQIVLLANRKHVSSQSEKELMKERMDPKLEMFDVVKLVRMAMR